MRVHHHLVSIFLEEHELGGHGFRTGGVQWKTASPFSGTHNVVDTRKHVSHQSDRGVLKFPVLFSFALPGGDLRLFTRRKHGKMPRPSGRQLPVNGGDDVVRVHNSSPSLFLKRVLGYNILCVALAGSEKKSGILASRVYHLNGPARQSVFILSRGRV